MGHPRPNVTVQLVATMGVRTIARPARYTGPNECPPNVDRHPWTGRRIAVGPARTDEMLRQRPAKSRGREGIPRASSARPVPPRPHIAREWPSPDWDCGDGDKDSISSAESGCISFDRVDRCPPTVRPDSVHARFILLRS